MAEVAADRDVKELVEERYPLPIGTTYRKLRQLEDASPSQQLKQLGDLFEVVIKYLAAIACRVYLVEDGKSEKVNELLRQFASPSLGRWLELLRESLRAREAAGGADKSGLRDSLARFFFGRLEGGRAHPAAVAAEALREKLGDRGAKIEPTLGQTLELYVTFRNAKLGHGATLSEVEYEGFLSALLPMLRELLKGLLFLRDLPLVYVREVRVKQLIFEHRADLCMGRDFDPVRLVTSQTPLNDREVYVCELVAGDGVSEIKMALSLSPYLIVDHCPDCKQQQAFFFNSIKGRRIEYLSYRCGHEMAPGGYLADFESIKEFLAGRVSTHELFRGKVYGDALASEVRGLSPEDARIAQGQLERGRELARAQQIALARKELLDAVERDPDLAEAHFLLAMTGILAEEPLDPILVQLETACRLAPEEASWRVAHARVLIALGGRDEEARTLLAQALEADPAHQEARRLSAALAEPAS